MHALRTRIVGLFLVASAVACGPLGPFAGGRLEGAAGPPQVADWSFVADEDTLELETRPQDPHSVTTWFVAKGPLLYVPSSMIRGTKDPRERSWVAHLVEDPRVRVRLDGIVYERVATRVEDAAEFEAARDDLEAKYGLDPEERDPERTIWIFRLGPRP